MKVLSFVCALLAVLLSDVMCVVVTYEYCIIYFGMKYEGYSASPEIVLVLLIPFLLCIAFLLVASISLRHKAQEESK